MSKIPTPQQIAYMKAHSDDTLVPNIIACCSVCGIASIIFILMRFWSRKLVHGRVKVQMSDWLLIIAWVFSPRPRSHFETYLFLQIFYAVFDVCFAMTTKYGGGRHIIYITNARMMQIVRIPSKPSHYVSRSSMAAPSPLTNALPQLNIVDENTYCSAMAFIKLSILKMYGEIFVSRRFRTFLWIVATFMLLWTITCSITTIFQCTPIEYNWDTTITSGHCINYGAFVLAAGALNIVTDFTLLLMPIPLVWRLHTSRQKKWQIILTFAMGSRYVTLTNAHSR